MLPENHDITYMYTTYMLVVSLVNNVENVLRFLTSTLTTSIECYSVLSREEGIQLKTISNIRKKFFIGCSFI